ncbi:prepilin peptidase [Aerococcaceae bacterium DSM 111020]|nr:prepilin peptidase [Aerococcaceae bacterium DSM 111020]
MFYFIFGTIFGSASYCFFSNKSNFNHFLYQRSTCDHCKHTLQWNDLIPIFSYCFCLGRCKYCHSPIGYKYLFLELLMGCIFLYALPHLFSDYFYFFPSFIIICLMIVSDIHNFYVSDKLQILLFGTFFFYVLVSGHTIHFLSSILILIILLSLQLLLPGSLGGADIKFMTIICLLLPLVQIPLFIFISSLLGLFSILLLRIKILPFIPYLAISFFIIFFQLN